MTNGSGDDGPGRDKFEREIGTNLDDMTPDKPKGMPLHTRIILGLVIGAVAGLSASAIFGANDPQLNWVIDNITSPVGALFLRLLIMTVVPLVFSALVIGVAGVGDPRKIGRIGLKAFGYTLVISAISVVIALTLTNTIRPGERISPETALALEAEFGGQAAGEMETALIENPTAPVLTQVIETLVPVNPFASIATETPDLLLSLIHI